MMASVNALENNAQFGRQFSCYSKSKISFQSLWNAPSGLKRIYPDDRSSNSSETLLTDYETTWRRNREDGNLKKRFFYVLSARYLTPHSSRQNHGLL
jgi:hypothetical protein